MNFKKIATVCFVALTAVAAVFAGGTSEKATSTPVQTKEKTEITDIWEAYDPAIDVTVIGSYNVPEDGVVPKDTTPTNQKWVEIMNKYLGINLKYDWVVPAAQGAQKLDVTIASGMIPDVLQVDEGQFELLKESDMLGDLWGAYDYLMPAIKANLEADPTLLKKCTNEKGELLAIPYALDNFQQTQLIYLRADWLEKLGLEVPTSLDELYEVAKAFVEQDPDGNGINDTVGIALYKELYAGFGGAAGLMNGFGAYPKMWLKAADGSLICGDVQPEMREALLFLQKLYIEGLLDPEYVAMDSNTIVEALVGGKAGIVLGEWWVPAWPLNMTIDRNPEARWVACNLLSKDGGIANTGLNHAFIGSFNVIKKGMKHPEALAKMLNLYYDTRTTTKSCREEVYDRTLFEPKNGFVYNWLPVRMEDTFLQANVYYATNEALEKGDPTGLNTASQKLYDATLRMRENFNGTDWGLWYSRAAKDGGMGLTEKVRNEKLYVMNEFYGSYTPTMITSQGVLDTRRDEVFHRIITGAPIEEFDKFVDEWYKMGGKMITEEVNAWYKTQQ